MEEILLANLKSFEEAETNPPSFIEICQRIGDEVSIIECNQAFVKLYKKGEFYADSEFNRFSLQPREGFLKYHENL